MIQNHLSQRGRSMIEMLGVLAIIGVLSVAGIAGYSKAMEKHRINKTIQQMNTIINNVRIGFSGKGKNKPYADFGSTKNLGSDGMRAALAMGAFPSEMFGEIITVPVVIRNQGGGSGGSGFGSGSFSYGSADIPIVQNEYRGDVYIITEDDGETFSLIFEGLPKKVAVELGTANWGAGDSEGLQEVFLQGDDEE